MTRCEKSECACVCPTRFHLFTGKHHCRWLACESAKVSTVCDGTVMGKKTSSGSVMQNWTAGRLFIEKWNATECRTARGGANFHQEINHKLSESESEGPPDKINTLGINRVIRGFSVAECHQRPGGGLKQNRILPVEHMELHSRTNPDCQIHVHLPDSPLLQEPIQHLTGTFRNLTTSASITSKTSQDEAPM